MSKHIGHPLDSGADISGVAGKVGRERGGKGDVFSGQKNRNVSKGVNFHPASAHNNPDPRKGVGQPAPHTRPTL